MNARVSWMQVFCFTTCSVLSCFTLFGIDILLHSLYCASSRTFELNWNPHWQCYRSLLATCGQLLEESCLDLANNWMTNNWQKRNADKTKCMLSRSPRAGADPLLLHIHLSGPEIEQVYISIGKLFLSRTFLIGRHDRDVWYVPRTESSQLANMFAFWGRFRHSVARHMWYLCMYCHSTRHSVHTSGYMFWD